MKVYFLHGCFPCSTSRTKKKEAANFGRNVFSVQECTAGTCQKHFVFFPRIIHYSACQAAANGKLH